MFASTGGEHLLAKLGGIPADVLRNLGHELLETRIAAFYQLFDFVNRKEFKVNPLKILGLIEYLSTNLMRPSQPHYCKQGGLVGLAVLTIALMKKSASPFLNKILPPIVRSLRDMDMSVCEYACETICVIAMVVKGEIWVFLGKILRGFFWLYSCPGVNEPYFTERLDAIIQYAGTVDGKFQIEEFVKFIRERISTLHPNERVYMLRWIHTKAPHHVETRWFLEMLVDGSFNMLWNSAPMEEAEILRSLRNILYDIKRGRFRQENVDFGVFAKPLLHFACMDKQVTKFAALTWINELSKLGVYQLASYYSVILDAIVFNFSDPEENIRQLAHEINEDILEAYARPAERSNIIAVLSIFTEEIGSEWQDTQIVALHCIIKLLEWHRAEVLSYFKTDFASLIKALSDPSDEVVLLVLEVHACIARDAEQFDRLFDFLAQKFRTDFSLLQMRGPLIMSELCALLKAEQVHRKFSSLCEGEDFLKFTSKFLLRPNFHLVKSTELAGVRVLLNQTLVNAAGEDLFHYLCSSLGYSESGTICLRRLAQAYRHENYVLLPLIKEDMNMIPLTDLEAFVCLLRCPTFDYRKFQWIERGCSIWLLKLLYCLLMLLPQCIAPGNSIWLLKFLYFLRLFLPKRRSIFDLFQKRLQRIPEHSFVWLSLTQTAS